MRRVIGSEERDSLTRRSFIASAAIAAAGALGPACLMASTALNAPTDATAADELESRLAADPTRPQFHLLPARNWMNDPNGPIYFGGKYHMFFQYNPQAAVWGDMSWNHAVSPDMIHWKHLPVALTPTPGGPDSFGCFSGSALQVGRRVYQVYTGTRKGPKELATIRDGEDTVQESQCLAYSDDPELIHWTKLPEPVVPLPPSGLSVTGFRDPSAWRVGDRYYMTVGSGVAKVGGCVLLYRSADLKHWEYLHELTSGHWNGKLTANPCDDGEMWECPDFFPLDGGHVLIYSTLGKVFWQSGKFDEQGLRFNPAEQGELDLGAFYAPKTQLDAQGRRILWGWIQEHRIQEQMREAGWSGMMSLPRVMRLDSRGRLQLDVLPELSRLREAAIPVTATEGRVMGTLPGATGEFLCSAPRDSGMEVSLTLDGSALLHAAYSPATHSFHLDGRDVALEQYDPPVLHGFVDGSVLELIVGGRIGYTRRFYFAGSTAPDIPIIAQTSAGHTGANFGPAAAPKLSAWRIRPISPNRLTTPAENAYS